MRSLAVAVLLALTASPALAERPRLEYVPAKIDPSRSIGAVVNSKTIFLNRCMGGCKVNSGFTDSRTNKSGIGQGTLSAFEHGNTSWTQVVDCAKDVFKRFNVTVTDVDPGPNVDHFEIMVAGSPGQIGLSSGIGGIAEYSCTSPGVCSKYLPDALVFAFANVYANDPDEICGTVAQEIAHTWSLDHVTDASDPMTYFSYSGRRQFKDGVACGSDCVSGSSPFGLTCTGNTDCKAGSCASDGTVMACTIPCDLSAKNCPSGFGCLQAGEIGVCWAGFDDGSGGCCDTGGNGPASMLLALGIGGVLVRRRRRRDARR
jgi:MYXO-CTERM domain-containing protein